MNMKYSCIPGMVRLSCEDLSDWIDNDDVSCPSTAFFGNGLLAKIVSVLLLLHSCYSIVPLTMFFIVTYVGNMRHYKACRIYGLIVRADTRSPPTTECPVLDLSIPNNIRAWVRSRLGLQFFGNFSPIEKNKKKKNHSY
jgi:hypothetical protein